MFLTTKWARGAVKQGYERQGFPNLQNGLYHKAKYNNQEKYYPAITRKKVVTKFVQSYKFSEIFP